MAILRLLPLCCLLAVRAAAPEEECLEDGTAQAGRSLIQAKSQGILARASTETQVVEEEVSPKAPVPVDFLSTATKLSKGSTAKKVAGPCEMCPGMELMRGNQGEAAHSYTCGEAADYFGSAANTLPCDQVQNFYRNNCCRVTSAPTPAPTAAPTPAPTPAPPPLCDFCARHGGIFKPENIGGLDDNGDEYTCAVAQEWQRHNNAIRNCEDSQTLWFTACCPEAPTPSPTPVPPVPCNLCPNGGYQPSKIAFATPFASVPCSQMATLAQSSTEACTDAIATYSSVCCSR